MEISPAAQSASSSAFSSLTKNIDTFLTLLTAQLRNQDPLEPLDTEKFTSQLVQFASVEQSIKTNSHLEALIALQAATERDSALGFIGKTASIETDLAASDGAGAAWTYTLPASAASASIAVLNSAGQVVATAPASTLRGAHTFAWNGASHDGTPAPAGTYKLIVSASTAEGAPLPVTISTDARILSAVFSHDGAQLETAAGLVSVDAIRRITAAQS